MTRLAKPLRLLLAGLSASLLTTAAAAQTATVVCELDGAQAGTGSSATGTMTGTVDTVAMILTFDLSFSGLSSNQTAAHIHEGSFGQNGPIHFNIGLGQQTNAMWSMNPSQVATLLDGGFYINLHTQTSPGGEIRGQITVAPESYCLCTSGPCGNDNSAGGCVNNTGGGASLQVDGQASIGLDSLTLTASGLPPNQFGIFYMGPNQISAAFGNGQRCVGGSVHRFPLANSGGAGTIVLGPGIAAFTGASFPPSGQIQAGQVWNMQCWYRDPAGSCGSSFNLSEALSVVWVP